MFEWRLSFLLSELVVQIEGPASLADKITPFIASDAVVGGKIAPDLTIQYSESDTSVSHTWKDNSLLSPAHVSVALPSTSGVTEILFYPLAAFLAHRGWQLVHGGVVRKDNQFVFLFGRSEAGKSTTAVRLCKEGFSLLADDIFFLSLHDGKFHIMPFPRPPRPRGGGYHTSHHEVTLVREAITIPERPLCLYPAFREGSPLVTESFPGGQALRTVIEGAFMERYQLLPQEEEREFVEGAFRTISNFVRSARNYRFFYSDEHMGDQFEGVFGLSLD